ncbi:hypothetical protein FB451DRAFT_1189555 [Mycena latifolia]|nr:hypothetical protein FB451DRAFT_1189555 [Mycena latifolia]
MRDDLVPLLLSAESLLRAIRPPKSSSISLHIYPFLCYSKRLRWDGPESRSQLQERRNPQHTPEAFLQDIVRTYSARITKLCLQMDDQAIELLLRLPARAERSYAPGVSPLPPPKMAYMHPDQLAQLAPRLSRFVLINRRAQVWTQADSDNTPNLGRLGVEFAAYEDAQTFFDPLLLPSLKHLTYAVEYEAEEGFDPGADEGPDANLAHESEGDFDEYF